MHVPEGWKRSTKPFDEYVLAGRLAPDLGPETEFWGEVQARAVEPGNEASDWEWWLECRSIQARTRQKSERNYGCGRYSGPESEWRRIRVWRDNICMVRETLLPEHGMIEATAADVARAVY